MINSMLLNFPFTIYLYLANPPRSYHNYTPTTLSPPYTHPPLPPLPASHYQPPPHCNRILMGHCSLVPVSIPLHLWQFGKSEDHHELFLNYQLQLGLMTKLVLCVTFCCQKIFIKLCSHFQPLNLAVYIVHDCMSISMCHLFQEIARHLEWIIEIPMLSESKPNQNCPHLNHTEPSLDIYSDIICIDPP